MPRTQAETISGSVESGRPTPMRTRQTSAEPKPRTAKSIECSKQADAKKLHGKERQVFRSKCKRGDYGAQAVVAFGSHTQFS